MGSGEEAVEEEETEVKVKEAGMVANDRQRC